MLLELQSMVQTSLERNRKREREAKSRGEMACFCEGDYVLVSREHFSTGEKLSLRWRCLRRISKAMSDYIYQVEDLRNGNFEDVHACRLRFYADSALNSAAILPHVVSSETGMPVTRPMGIEESEKGVMVHVRWKRFSKSGKIEDTLEPLR